MLSFTFKVVIWHKKYFFGKIVFQAYEKLEKKSEAIFLRYVVHFSSTELNSSLGILKELQASKMLKKLLLVSFSISVLAQNGAKVKSESNPGKIRNFSLRPIRYQHQNRFQAFGLECIYKLLKWTN